MSKGPGTIQRTILDAVTNGIGGDFPDARFLPVLVIADAAGYDTTKLAVRQSFARAARKLEDAGTVKLWDLQAGVPFGRTVISRAAVERTMLCVSPAGFEPTAPVANEDGFYAIGFVSTRTDVELAQFMCADLFESVTDPFRAMRRTMAPVD